MQHIKNLYHLFTAILANLIYGFPARKITVIGVTGTDGKTTTTSLIYHILKSSGKKAAMITSIGAYVYNKVYDIGFHVTTPSPFGLQKFIRKIVDAGNEFLVLEVTSHALDQNRVWGIPFSIGVLTNVTHEHLDYHKTKENYLATKLKLLQKSKISVVNRDDKSYLKIHKFLKKSFFSYSLSDQNADVTPKKFPFTTSLLGEFNKLNSLAAIAAVKQLGISDAIIRKALLSFAPPIGRQEVVYDKEFRIIIDFAHTPNAFEKILPAVKPKKGRLIHVFGSASERDTSKRPFMGKASSKYADVIILTAEDPRKESIEKINREISGGVGKHFVIYSSSEASSFQKIVLGYSINNKKICLQIPDRKNAIQFAISIARKNDTVLITGKSHEKSMNYGHGEEPWDEFQVVHDALKNKSKSLNPKFKPALPARQVKS